MDHHLVTITGQFTVQEILNYNPRTHKYTVLFSMPDGSTYEDTIPESFLRGSTPQIMAPIEKAYHEKTVTSAEM